MKVFKPSNTTHTLKFIPRFYGTPELIQFKDEFTGNLVEFTFFTSNLTQNYYYLTFDNSFNEMDKGEITIKDNGEVIYRGAYVVTEQETQTFELTKDTYEQY